MPNNSTFIPEEHDCDTLPISFAVGMAYNFTKITLLVPLYTFILYLGVQRWKQQRSFATVSNVDIFTYHLAALTSLGVLATVIHFCISEGNQRMHPWLSFLFNSCMYGESYVHILTCLEQYLAVVHPIVYRGLKNTHGTRIRNISIGCVWLLTVFSSACISLYVDIKSPFLYMIPFAISLAAVSFCCLSVLCVLVRPGPGEGNRADQSRQRAFNTIAAIFVVLCLWLGGILVSYAFYTKLPILPELSCVLAMMAYWFNLPSGLVLPVLYLYRAGKLFFCCHKKG